MIGSFWKRFQALWAIAGVMLAIYCANRLGGMRLNHYGVLPRNPDYFPHILSAPFIHGSWQHLVNNLVGFFVLGGLCLLKSPRHFMAASLFIIILSGGLVWLFGRDSMHLGASGWIFGLWSLCISHAWFEYKFTNLVIAVVVLVFYGGMIWGVLPSDTHISFEYHFFGAVSGVVCAACFKKLPSRVRRYVS